MNIADQGRILDPLLNLLVSRNNYWSLPSTKHFTASNFHESVRSTLPLVWLSALGFTQSLLPEDPDT